MNAAVLFGLAFAVVSWPGAVLAAPEFVSLGRMRPARGGLPEREIVVWLPPGYDVSGSRRYPVLYVLDGQNQFLSRRSFAGKTWRFDQAGRDHVRSGRGPFIAVAIDNAGLLRSDEYLPERAPDELKGAGEAGGRLEDFLAFVLEQVKPAVDREFRTRTGPDDTGIIGSSYGGLAAFCIGWRHADAFRRVAAVSPRLRWNRGALLRLVRRSRDRPPIRLWLDMGTREDARPGASRRDVLAARRLRAALLRRGFREGRDLAYLEEAGAAHDEDAWARRLPSILGFLFP